MTLSKMMGSAFKYYLEQKLNSAFIRLEAINPDFLNIYKVLFHLFKLLFFIKLL